MQFLYFFPGQSGLTETDMKNLDVAYALDGVSLQRAGEGSGPGGNGGLLVQPIRGLTRTVPKYLPDEQEWIVEPIAKKWWLGFDPKNKPGPKDLERPDTINGYSVPMADGQDWHIPTARSYPAGTPLPQIRKMDDEGKIIRQVRDEYKALYLLADKVWCAAECKETITEAEVWDICVAAIACNHRMGPMEISALELLDDSAEFSIMQCLIERQQWPDWRKAVDG